MKKQKVAILGGGMGALATALALTDPEHPARDSYEITIFQMGWRLGGKGASGRSANPLHHRIEEHGLHAWFGFYDNAFALYKKMLPEFVKLWPPKEPPASGGTSDEWGEEAPLKTWTDAFKSRKDGAFIEHHDQTWKQWPVVFPPGFPEEPGSAKHRPPRRDFFVLVYKYFCEQLKQYSLDEAPETITEVPEAKREELKELLGHEVPRELTPNELIELNRAVADKLLETNSITENPHFTNAVLGLILWGLERLLKVVWFVVQDSLNTNDKTRQLWIFAHFGYAALKGVIKDRLIEDGFDVINHLDFREWLEVHALPYDTKWMLSSPLVEAVYISSFAYRKGDMSMEPGESHPSEATFEAGTALRGLLLSTFAYKQAIGFKMIAGTGETIFSPIYLVLKKRGVRFKFFHQVTGLHCDAEDATHPIVEFEVRKQVALKSKEYQPLINVKSLPCWPSLPLYDQIQEGDKLAESGLDLESPFETWEGGSNASYSVGKSEDNDFQLVVLGISLGALPMICSSMLKHSYKWRNMLKHVKTTRTQSLQLWLNKSSKELGWPLREGGLISFYYGDPERKRTWNNDLGTWSDTTHTRDWENWPDTKDSGPLVQHVAYFCSALPGDPQSQSDLENETKKVKAAGKEMFEQYLPKIIWEKLEGQGSDGASVFDWGALVDLDDQSSRGSERFDAQYWKANIYPSDLYVLSVPGSTQHRLPPHSPHEFPNLYLSGDWTRNGLNCGAMETAVMGGLLAAHEMCGFPKRQDIIGIDF